VRYRALTGALAGALAILAALLAAVDGAQAFDQSKYPDWTGQWLRPGQPRWVPPGERAPLTPEYQSIFEWNLKDVRDGGHGTEPSWTCLGPGMPRIMNVYEPMEIVITPGTTYILISHIHDNRRIYTDGRAWPKELEPAFKGYSIGKWIDADGDGRFDTLEVETRGMKGPRAYDTTGLPLHSDNKTVVLERLTLDKDDRTVLWNEITTIDSALTRPWTVKKRYLRSPETRPHWLEQACSENNLHVRIGNEGYMLSADGLLMPTRKGQQPPDLRYFKPSQK
jgi:hypothetical protein